MEVGESRRERMRRLAETRGLDVKYGDIQKPWRDMGRRYYYGPDTVVYKMSRGLPV